jgi:hypothetical protein
VHWRHISLDEGDIGFRDRRERPVREHPAWSVPVVAAPLAGFFEQGFVLDHPLVRRRARRHCSDLGEERGERVLAALVAVDLEEPVERVRERGIDAWHDLLAATDCGIAWRGRELLEGVTPQASSEARREALGRAGEWLGRLPARLALEQEDAVRSVSERCGYSAEVVERAFRARFWDRDRLARSADPECSPAVEL